MNVKAEQKWGVIGGAVAAVAIIVTVVSVNAFNISELSTQQDTASQITDISKSPKVKVIASFYPLYEFARNIGGEIVEVTTFIPIGVEPHDWEPTVGDMQQLGKADVFIYNGAGFEPFGNSVAVSNEFANVIIVEAAKSKGIDLIQSTGDEQEKNRTNQGFNPHIWLDPVLVKSQIVAIKDAFVKADPANTKYYEDNANAYLAKLDALDAEIRSGLSSCKKDTFISFHEAFTYFAKRYGLKQVAISGLVPEAEASPAKLKELVDYAKANNVKVIYAEELVDPRLAEVLANEAGAKVMILSPIEGLNNEDIQKGDVTYLAKMEKNLQNLKVGLECK